MAAHTGPSVEQLVGPFDLTSLVQAYPDQWKFLLASGGGGRGPSSRWSMVLRQTGEAICSDDSDYLTFFDRLEAQLATGPESLQEFPVAVPFIGGWFVYLGYEMATTVEPTLVLPRCEDGLPYAYAARCGAAVVYDHDLEQSWLVCESDQWLAQVKEEIETIRSATRPPTRYPALSELHWSIAVDEPERFISGVEAILAYIEAGDVFQVNLSRQWRAKSEAELDPLAVYNALSQSNPGPFSGYAKLPGGCVISSSPERLVERRGRHIQTRPIAGTRPRSAEVSQDLALIEELRSNLKEQAEHVMLIDLERNDLGRVCVPGSVRVDELMVVESYAHVHHIVSNVIGQLRPQVPNSDILRAVFPGGTITGCPKVRCMEIIAELEQVGRSFYTGAMGYIADDGAMDFNILIRSVGVFGNQVSFRTGAGIVADSMPWSELKETEAKAKGLLNAFGMGSQHEH